MKKDKKRNSFEDKKELELLNKYYNVDTENKNVTMLLHYDKANDLIDSRIISKDNYLFDYEELTSINERIKRIPIVYDVDIDIQIDDYEDFEPEKLIDGFNDALELNNYNYGRERRKKWLQAAFVLTVGLTILFITAYGKLNSWFGSGQRGEVFAETIDIFGWVFIWQCVTIAFLTPSELGVSSSLFKRRVKKITFLDKDNKKLCSEETQKFYKNWKNDKKLSIATRWALLISGFSLILLGIIRTLEFIGEYNIFDVEIMTQYLNSDENVALFIILLIFYVTQFIVLFSAGILNLALYRRKNVHKKASYVFSTLLLLVLIVDILFFVTDTTGTMSITNEIITILMTLFYVAGVFITFREIKKEKYKAIKKDDNVEVSAVAESKKSEAIVDKNQNND